MSFPEVDLKEKAKEITPVMPLLLMELATLAAVCLALS